MKRSYPIDVVSDAPPTAFDESNTPILEFHEANFYQPGWNLYFKEARGDGVDGHWIGGELKDRDWALEQAQEWLNRIGYPWPHRDSVAARESRLRSKARRMGLQLQKSRSRTPAHPDWGTYRLVNENNIVVAFAGMSDYGLSLDDVEIALTEEAAR